MSNIKIGDKLRYIGPTNAIYHQGGVYRIDHIDHIDHSEAYITFENHSHSYTAYSDIFTPCDSVKPWWEKAEVE